MKPQIPLPQVQAFLVCQEFWYDERTDRNLLLHPLTYVPAEEFPLDLLVSVYLQIKSGHGRNDLDLQLRDLEGDMLWRWQAGQLDHPDPLFPHRLTFHGLILPISEPGKYDLVVLTNGEELAYQSLCIGPRKFFVPIEEDTENPA